MLVTPLWFNREKSDPRTITTFRKMKPQKLFKNDFPKLTGITAEFLGQQSQK